MALRQTCNAPEEPLDGRETATTTKKLADGATGTQDGFLSFCLSHCLWVESTNSEIAGEESVAHSVLSPILAVSTSNSENHYYYPEPMMLLPIYQATIFQLTFSQASVFILIF